MIAASLPRGIRKLPVLAVLYTALLTGANPAAAAGLTPDQRAGIAALRDGDMRKLVIHDAPVPAPDAAFVDAAGAETTLADSNGKVRLVNFWATWCAPCRQEKPALDALQRELGGPDFAVIAIATGRNSLDAITRFNAETGVTALETNLDPRSALAAAMGIPGLPVTVVLDRDGSEIARLTGGADWEQESARAIVQQLINLEGAATP